MLPVPRGPAPPPGLPRLPGPPPAVAMLRVAREHAHAHGILSDVNRTVCVPDDIEPCTREHETIAGNNQIARDRRRWQRLPFSMRSIDRHELLIRSGRRSSLADAHRRTCRRELVRSTRQYGVEKAHPLIGPGSEMDTRKALK